MDLQAWLSPLLSVYELRDVFFSRPHSKLTNLVAAVWRSKHKNKKNENTIKKEIIIPLKKKGILNHINHKDEKKNNIHRLGQLICICQKSDLQYITDDLWLCMLLSLNPFIWVSSIWGRPVHKFSIIWSCSESFPVLYHD